MALAAHELIEIEQALAAPDAAPQAFATLRQRFPHLAWIRCDASDVTETPFRSLGAFDLHLLDGADHCAQITDDPARATGIVLAKRAVKP
ncbi:hypothetical protein G8O24_03935 [Bradyrhizobium sp. INPA01-394B]|uniref:DUF6129 domain-containing protein n=1 Tax=Bradyrhizobium campsiandrae TaxID=1729892 RepID=A0ABR7UEW7_9BRAD|nr:DUF6129 family protein [Bradyrhizobium campsiandrae]MBC9876497.1 hypothetical protein [Bradyrhizobium campsiandrae]MBC9982646.1 hypothetical protein [Bradyrhizobium campsiandrae]